jgi:hypothetical protein
MTQSVVRENAACIMGVLANESNKWQSVGFD